MRACVLVTFAHKKNKKNKNNLHTHLPTHAKLVDTQKIFKKKFSGPHHSAFNVTKPPQSNQPAVSFT